MSMSVSDLQALPEDSPSLLHVVVGHDECFLTCVARTTRSTL
jgi:hypothetical protein